MEITVPIDFDPFAGPELIKAVPTTEAQLEIFASCLIGGNDASRSYNESISLQLKGHLDLVAMRFALTTTINRHEALRSAFSTDGKKMSIYKEVSINLLEEDISNKNEDAKQQFITDFKKKDALTPFDLLNGPLFRVSLFKLSDHEHHFTFTAHHLICDGWSLGVILMELSKIYSTTVKGEKISLPQASKFSDYVTEQIHFFQTNDYRIIENYWLEQFQAPIPVFDIPTDFVRPAVRTYKSHREDYALNKELASSIKKMGAAAGCSFVVTLLSAFEVFLYKISGQRDIIVGLPSSGQSATDNFELVGHCVNLLPLKSSINPEQSFFDYLKQRKDLFYNDFDHQQFTFGSLLKKLKIARDTSRVPIVPIMFNIDMGMGIDVDFYDLTYKLISNPREYEAFEIFLNATGTEQSLVLEWSYNTQLFKQSTITRMMEEFELMLSTITDIHTIKIKDITFETAESIKKFEKWNNTFVEYRKDKSLVSLIHETALHHSGKTAIEYNQQKLSYKDLDEKSNQFADLLMQQGVAKGETIGLVVDRSPEMIIALLAIMKSGAGYIPLDPEYPRERIEYMLEDSTAKILITSKKYSQHFKTTAREVILEDCVSNLSQFSKEFPQTNLGGSDLAYILYTSGSTGKPKGVQIEHHNLVNFLNSMQKLPGITANDSLLAITTISFDIAGLELYLPLVSGAKIVLADTETTKDGYKLLALIKEKNITILQATPSSWRMLLDCGWDKPFDFKALCGGEALPKDIADKLVVLCNSLWNMYGPTETTIWSTVKQIPPDCQSITIGRPIDNTQVYILDEYLKGVPIGATGEIFIAGEGVARGYFNKIDLTAERFLLDPFAKDPNKKMYRTGDLGKFLENGEIQCHGRIDQQVKIRGHRIELGEIEYSLGKIEGVKEAVVVATEDLMDKQLIGYVVMDNATVDQNNKEEDAFFKAKLKKLLKELLPDYMVPGNFVLLSQLPLTPNGKIDKKALPSPAYNTDENQQSYLAPRTDTEQLIADIWSQILNIPKVSMRSDFFELGGHSLIAVKVIFNIEKAIGIRLPIATFFENSTVEKLAQIIVKRQTPDDLVDDNDINQVIESEQEPEEIWLPALESQIEIWIACKFGGDDANRAYNLSLSERLSGNFNCLAMERALQSIVNRHDSLRTTFSEDGTQMCIHKNHPLQIQYEDISALQPTERTLFIDRMAVQNAEMPFNLLTGPLFKASIVKLSDNQHYLTITAHHIICDGSSLGILIEELSILYSAYAKGESPKLSIPPKFSDYATESQAFYNSKEYENIGKYWLDKFKNDVPVLDIPTDFHRPANRTFASKQINHKIDPELFAEFIQITSKAASSAVISLRTILEILLYRLTGQHDIVIGLPVAGQFADAKIEGLVGHCANMLPLRSHVDGLHSYLDYLKQRKSAILEAYEYQRYTTGSLLKQLNISRDNSRIPLVSVISNINLNQEDSISFYELNSQSVSHPTAYDFFELTLNISGSIKSPVLNWAYNTNLFKPETIGKLMADFEHLLKEITRNPEIKIKDISVNDSDLFLKIKKWNNTSAEYPKDESLGSLIHKTALQHPDQIAIEFYKQKISYKDLNEKSNQFATLLIQEGVVTGQTIGLVADRSAEMIIALLAIIKSGAAYIPLDPEYPRERIEYMLDDSNAKILITSKRYSQHFKTTAREIILDDSFSKLTQFSKELPLINVNGSDLVYILYTSGSTGKPKGVQIEHHNLVNFLLSMQKVPGIKPNDSLLAITTISFDPAGLELYLPLITGAKIILADTETARDGYKLLELIKEKNVTLVQATPPTWRMLLDSGWNKAYGFKALCGGEALPIDMAAKLLTLCSSLWNVYGPTETTVWSTIKQITSVEEPITIGRPIDNMQAYILDEYFHNVPLGAAGEIFIAGEGLGRGYCNKADLTAERFIPNPFEKDNNKKMYRSGDIGRFLENGEIQCLGRSDNQVKIRGHRIELGEIENNIIKLEDIKNAVVLAREDYPGNQRLVAYVILSFTNNKEQDDSEVTERKIKWNESLKRVLPPYMIPNDWVILNKFPLTPNNKIDKKALPKPVLQINGYSRKNSRFPVTINQKLIAEIWEDELQCQSVTLDDDFFELGGHSLIAVRMMTRLEKETGKRIPLTALFESPTVEKLASVVELDKKDIKWNSLVPIKTYGNKIPIYLIHGDGLSVLIFSSLAKNLHPEQPLYGLQAKGLNGIDENFDRMESIAAHYIEEILQQNPEGPYAIGGYSFGGLIAFEMGKQLKAMGKKVVLLGLFDSYAEESIYYKPLATKIALKTYEIFMRVVFALAFMTKEPKIVITNKIRLAKILLKPILEKASLKKEADPESFVAYSKKSSTMYKIAYRNYKITPYEGSVDLFRAKKQTAYLPDFKYMGWKPFALKGVNIHDVPGNHLAIFKSPNVEELAKILQDSLDKASMKANEND